MHLKLLRTTLKILLLLSTPSLVHAQVSESDFTVLQENGHPSNTSFIIGTLNIPSPSIAIGDSITISSTFLANLTDDELASGWSSLNILVSNKILNKSYLKCETFSIIPFIQNKEKTVSFDFLFNQGFPVGSYFVQAYVTPYFSCQGGTLSKILYSNILTRTLNIGVDSLDLQVGKITVPGAPLEIDNNPSVKPEMEFQVNVPISGSGFNTPENRSAVVTLKVGSHEFEKEISLSSIGSGALTVPFLVTLSSSENGTHEIVASIKTDSSVTDVNTSNNSAKIKLHVLCDIGDFGHTPEFFSQADDSWASDAYGPKDDPSETMKMYGCYLSSVAMNMTAYGILQTVDGDVLDAGSLNAASKITKFRGKPSMVNMAGQVLAHGMVEYAREGVYRSCLKSIGSDHTCFKKASAAISVKPDKFIYDEVYARRQICNGHAIILSVKIPERIVKGKGRKEHSHFVLATGTTVDKNGDLTYKINDAGRSTRELGENKPLHLAYPKTINPITGMRPYLNLADPSMLAVHASENIHYVLTDPNGKKVGYNAVTDEKINQLPGSHYYHEFTANEDEDSDAPDLPGENILQHSVEVVDGVYKLDVFGTQTGPYNLNVYSYDEDGYINHLVPYRGWIMEGQAVQLVFDHTKAPLEKAHLKVSNAIFLDVKKPNGSIIVAGKISHSNEGQGVLINNSLTVSVGAYSKTIPMREFKKVNNKEKTFYYYDPNKKEGLSLQLNSDGEFRVHIADTNFIKSDKISIELQVDNLYGARIIELKCQGAVCMEGR